MSKGLALTIGLNSVNPLKYLYVDLKDLDACEADAKDMAALASSQGFEVTTLLTSQATLAKVTNEIRKAASSLTAVDIFLLTFSGHGEQINDTNSDELYDHKDETWCLYDGQLVDDEINKLFAEFPQGCRILMFSDSCHSGTVARIR